MRCMQRSVLHVIPCNAKLYVFMYVVHVCASVRAMYVCLNVCMHVCKLCVIVGELM